ncbi:hypothetical protein PMAYCL1PPCAC_11687, partial [Pristionchus mayeri]
EGLTGNQKCLGQVKADVGGKLLCAAKSIFESQFEPKTGIIVGAIRFTPRVHLLYRQSTNITDFSQDHPCSHGDMGDAKTAPLTSSEVIIALDGGLILYGCHNYIVIPHNLIQKKECASSEDPCTLTTVKHHKLLVAEDYTCCCNGTGCAAVIMDQGGKVNPFPLLRFNIQMDEAITGNLEAMLHAQGLDGRYQIGEELTSQNLIFDLSVIFDPCSDVILTCLTFFTIICVMTLLLCFQWFCKAIISVLTLLLLISGCVLDILDEFLPYPLLFFRAYIWLFVVNSLMGAYGNLVVVLCLDRYVAMHRPLYYRNQFAKRRIRYSLIVGSLVLGILTCLHWLWVNDIDEEGDIVENTEITDDWTYNAVRALSYLFKYLVPGVSMSTITWANILFLRRSYDDDLRIARQESMDLVVNSHNNISRISIFLAVTFIVCNWPYAVIDYFYDEEVLQFSNRDFRVIIAIASQLEQYTAYAIVVLIINFLQIVYIQLNLLFFALCSSVYRKALMHVLKKPANLFLALLEKLRAFLKWRSKSRDLEIYHEERFLSSSLSTDSGGSAKTVFTVC